MMHCGRCAIPYRALPASVLSVDTMASPLATAPVELPMGPWPLADSYQSTGPIIQSLSADSPGSHSLLNQGQWTYMADTRDLLATQSGLIPFVVHQALCHQPRQKDLGHRKMAQDAHLAAPWALEGYFLDPVLFEMLAKMSRLTLPEQPFHVPVWRRASLHTFALRLHHVMRVGHLESPMVWRSLLYPSPARLPLTWGYHQLSTAHAARSAQLRDAADSHLACACAPGDFSRPRSTDLGGRTTARGGTSLWKPIHCVVTPVPICSACAAC